MGLPLKVCPICSKNSFLICSKCKITYYCSKEHQVEHWKLHKEECMPFRLKLEKNRMKPTKIYQAKKSIDEDTLLFASRPFMIFPIIPLTLNQNVRHNMKTCMGCCREVRNFSVCSRCKWPVCNESCQDYAFHTRLECTVLANRKVGGQYFLFDDTAIPYNRNCTLRALLMKDTYPDKWEIFINMDSEISIANNKNNENLKLQHLKITKIFVREECKQTQFSTELIEKVFWTLDQNMKLSGRLPSCGYLNNVGSLITQSCHSNVVSYNAFKRDDPDANVLEKLERRYYSTRKISEGEFLSLPILDLAELQVSRVRRVTLLRTAGIICMCPICSDPTEMGTYLSAIVCQDCRKFPSKNLYPNSGYLIPKDPLDFDTVWKCNECPKTMTFDDTQAVQAKFLRDFVTHELDTITCNQLIKTCVEINMKAFNKKQALSNGDIENITTAMKKVEGVIRKIDKITEKNTTLHPNQGLMLCHVRFRHINMLYLYLSLNTEEEYHTSMWAFEAASLKVHPSFKFFAKRPHNWIELNEELRDKSAKLLAIYEKLMSHLNLRCGHVLFFLTFARWNILKENAIKHLDYGTFLKDLTDWSFFKHKADSCYRNKDADNHKDNPHTVVIIQTLEKMDSVDPSINTDTFSLFKKIIPT